MNILMLNHNVKERSTYFRAMGLARQIVRKDNHVTIMTISPHQRFRGTYSRVDGVDVIETPDLFTGPLRTGWDLWDTVWRMIKGHRLPHVDIVHAFDNRPAVILPSLYISRLHGARLCSDWADWWGRGGVIEAKRPKLVKILFGGVETFFEEHFRTYASAVTVTSKALRSRAIDLGIQPDRVFYIPSGADTERIRPMAREDARSTLNLPQHVPIIEYMGFVQYDIDLAIRAFKVVHDELPDARFLLVGPVGKRVEHIVNELELRENVIFTGIQPSSAMAHWLAAADVLLLPYQDTIYNRGRGPIKLGDYLASGRPVVTNPVGDLGELFAREKIGFLAGESPLEFAHKILILLRDKELAQVMGRNARTVAETSENWERYGSRLLGLYQSLIP